MKCVLPNLETHLMLDYLLSGAGYPAPVLRHHLKEFFPKPVFGINSFLRL